MQQQGGYNSYCFRLLFLIFFIMRAIRDFILFFVVVIIEIIRLIFEIDDCGIFDDFVFLLLLRYLHCLALRLFLFASLRERYFLPDLS